MKEDIKIESTDTFLIIYFQLVKFFFYSNFFFPDSESLSKSKFSHGVHKKVDFFEFFTFSTPLAHATCSRYSWVLVPDISLTCICHCGLVVKYMLKNHEVCGSIPGKCIFLNFWIIQFLWHFHMLWSIYTHIWGEIITITVV